MDEYILPPEMEKFLEETGVAKAVDSVKSKLDRQVSSMDYKWADEDGGFDYDTYVAQISRAILDLAEQNVELNLAMHGAATMCGEDRGTVAVMATIYYLKSRSTNEKEETEYIR